MLTIYEGQPDNWLTIVSGHWQTRMVLKDTILNLASKRRQFRTSDVLDVLNHRVSRQYVSHVINGLVREGRLVKAGSTRGAVYALPQNAPLHLTIRKRLTNQSLREDAVLDDLKRSAPFMARMRENVYSIFTYGFLEMLNNAIEHSNSPEIVVEVSKGGKQLSFMIRDFGIGVFRNVMQNRNLESELEAIQDLLKGKTTTAPKGHSGQGIFFTSKVADVFILESFDRRLRVDNIVKDYFIENLKPSRRGTRVIFLIAENSPRRLEDVFRDYQTDPREPAFDKSEVKVRLYTMGTEYVSRSEARRLMAGLEKFRSVVLDFDRVRTVGQGFADEIFRVFRQRHPGTVVTAINMSEPVRFVVERVDEA